MPFKCPIARAEYMRLWREKNKEYNKEYYEKNKEEIKEYTKSPQAIKVRRLSDWKRRGLIHDDVDELHDRYLEATHCDECEEEFVNDRGISQRCMDHCHQTGLFRNFLCKSCNFKRR